MNFDVDIAVLGGGASGLMAALAAKEAAPWARVAIYERQSRVGKKLLATGNGRCNLINTGIAKERYHGDTELVESIRALCPPEFVLDKFRAMGVEPRFEYGGRVYPMSGQAASVLDDLRLSLEEAGVEERCDAAVAALKPLPGGVEVHLGGGSARARRAVACFGGPASPHLGGSGSGLDILRACGHAASPFFPALTGLKTDPALVRPLKGARLEAELTLLADGAPIARETDDVIFAEYGLSGTAAMALSRALGEALRRGAGVEVSINALPGLDPLPRLRERQASFPTRAAGDFLTGLAHKKLAQTLLRLAAPDLPFAAPCGEMGERTLRRLAALLSGWRLPLRDTAGMEQAQVTAGGVRARDVDPATLASRKLPGLFIAGETLNVDGDCGGFNLYWAWASGYVAGRSAALSLS